MERLKILISLFLPFLLLTFAVQPVSAAYLRGGENVQLSKKEKVENPYLFGEKITTDAQIIGDLITAGGTLTLRGTTTGSINTAGGTIIIDANVGNSIRVAGGDIKISGRVDKDIVAAGGTVFIEKNASVGGDIIFTGGTLTVEGPVRGNIIANGGSIILKSKIDGNIDGEMGTLQIQEGSEIGGNLTYTSSQKALISDAAIIQGQQTYHPSAKKDSNNIWGRFFAAGTFFKLATDILFSLLLIYLFPGILKRLSRMSRAEPLKKSLIGLGFLFLTPLAGIMLLLIIWLGLSVLLIYSIFLILALMISKILVGWFALDWWNKRNKKIYHLDWKAGVLGPALVMLLFLIPVVGWLAIAAVFLITLGSLLFVSLQLRQLSDKS